MPAESGAKVFAVVVLGLVPVELLGVIVSSTLLISVADDANEEMMDMRSVLVTTMPVFLRKLCALEVADEAVGGAITGFSEARRFPDGIGAKVEPTKSEYRRFVYRIGVAPVAASSRVCTSQTFSLLVFQSFMRAFRASTMSSMMSNCGNGKSIVILFPQEENLGEEEGNSPVDCGCCPRDLWLGVL